MCREQKQLYHRAGLQEYMLDTGSVDLLYVLDLGLVDEGNNLDTGFVKFTQKNLLNVVLPV